MCIRDRIATAHAVHLLGGKVVLVDVEEGRPIIDCSLIEEKISSKTKVILPVHMNGRAANMNEIMKIAKKHSLTVIEDTQSIASKNSKGFLGTQSDIGCYSLAVAKTISTGQGGFVVTRNEMLANKIRAIRNHGVDDVNNVKFWPMPGFNFKFTDVLASIGIEQLKRLPERIKRFCDLYEIYKDKLVSPDFRPIPVDLNAGEVPIYIEYLVKGRNKKIDDLRKLSSGGKQWIAKLQISERERTGISSLKVVYNKVFGYYLEITKAHSDKTPEDYIRKQTLVNSERYITPELKDYEEKILSADEKIYDIESEIFKTLCKYIINSVRLLQKNAYLLNRLDVLMTFAQISVSNDFVRPKFINKTILKVDKGRHPVVEQLLPATERFVANSLNMDTQKNQIHLITGPNMAGKSTYLRQIGLIVYMAHLGCFVSAKSAEIGICDKLFTRVGASDNLAGGESTFLVEMNEAANILNNATENSLILLDEIGRGTATYDGLSLAWSITEYIHENKFVAARTLFATHYHELTNLDSTLERLENYHIAVKEFGNKIIFLREILHGPGDKSYGINVAEMAGLPREIISRATEILNSYIQDQFENNSANKISKNDQLSVFSDQDSQIRKELEELDVLNLSPLEAIRKLDELKKKYGLY